MPRGGAGEGHRGGKAGLSGDVAAVHGRYFPMANACGAGRAYQGPEEEDGCPEACRVDENLEVTAVPHPRYNHDPRAAARPGFDGPVVTTPPPFLCRPRDDDDDHAGYWDGAAATHVRRVPYPSALGATSVAGCCWWGRGALMTRGTCGLGRLNHRLGKRAYDMDRPRCVVARP